MPMHRYTRRGSPPGELFFAPMFPLENITIDNSNDDEVKPLDFNEIFNLKFLPAARDKIHV